MRFAGFTMHILQASKTFFSVYNIDEQQIVAL